MFEDSPQEVFPAECQRPEGLPPSLAGTFVVQSTAQYSLGGRAFNSWLDTYWKVHAVSIAEGELCYKTRLIRTGFYNNSVAKGTVAGQVLFLETTPPRDCWLMGVCNMLGGAANDNNFAVSYRMRDYDGGYRYSLMTDTEVHLDFDINTLDVIGSRHFKDSWGKPLHMRKGGGTHLQCEAGKGTSAIDCEGDLFGVVFEQGATSYVDLYRLQAFSPDVRVLVAHVEMPFVPGSMHSFGLTSEYAIIPATPFAIDSTAMLKGKDLLHSMKDTADDTPIYLVHLNTGAVTKAVFPGKLYYVHVVNSWQNSTHINFDVSAFERNSFSFDDPAMVLPTLRNKTARDSSTNIQTVRRYAIDFESMAVSETYLTQGPSLLDFPKVNPSYYGLPYCIYYGVEWKHNGRDYGSWALKKHNICTGEVLYYYEPNCYLAEGNFVPDGGPAEDDGVVLTVRTCGEANVSSFVTLDARTMAPISDATLPQKVGWFGHGAWYPRDTEAIVA